MDEHLSECGEDAAIVQPGLRISLKAWRSRNEPRLLAAPGSSIPDLGATELHVRDARSQAAHVHCKRWAQWLTRSGVTIDPSFGDPHYRALAKTMAHDRATSRSENRDAGVIPESSQIAEKARRNVRVASQTTRRARRRRR